MNQTTAITLQESARLVELEDIIERGVKTFIKVGEALAEIRDKQLYRVEYGTFEDYCREEWDMTIRHADRLMVASKTVAAISTGPIGPVPTTESQVRPLTSLKEPEHQREAWTQAVEASPTGKPTAKEVEAAVEVVKSKTRPIPETVLTPSQQEEVTQAEKDSETLWHLKSYWKKATKKDRTAFLSWADEQ